MKGRKEKAMSKGELEEKIRNLISQRELAKLLGVTTKTIIAWNRDGINGRTLTKVKYGRHVYYRPEDVDQFRKVIGGN